MSLTYYERDITSDLTGGVWFNKKILDTTATASTMDVHVAALTTETNYFFSDPNVPNLTTWQAGTWTTYINIPAYPDSYIYLAIAIDRINSSGTLASTVMPLTAEQNLATSGVYTFAGNGSSQSASATDRIRINCQFRNASHVSRYVRLKFNTSTESVITPLEALAPPVALKGVMTTNTKYWGP